MPTLEKADSKQVTDLALFDELPDLALVIEPITYEILRVNRHGASELGYTPEDLAGKHFRDIGSSTESAITEDQVARIANGETVVIDRTIVSANGDQQVFQLTIRLVKADPAVALVLGRPMRRSESTRFADLVMLADLTDDMFVVTDSAGYVTYGNAAASRIHGVQDVVGCHISEFAHPDDTAMAEVIERIAAGATQFEVRAMALDKDGATLHLGIKGRFDEESSRWLLVERDIARVIDHERQLELLNTDLRRRATTDELTGVANRRALREVLELTIHKEQPFSLLLIDMDDFKSVNDLHGHTVGDEFLRIVAKRIQGAAKLTDTVARLGGDEFVVVLPDVDGEQARQVAQRMIEAVGQDYRIGDIDLVRSCSIGLAEYVDGDDVNDVLRKADRASYRAKHAGRSRYSA